MLTTPANVRKLDGTPYADSTVTIDAYSMLPTMRFPDGTPAPDSLLVTCDGGPPVRVYAREDDRLDALATSVTALQAGTETPAGAQAKVDTHSADTTGVHGIADTSLLETQTGAQTKATAAQSAAISTAATDATTKASAAQAAAISAAATDATTKASAAQAAAISAAATDATTKAGNAQTAATAAAATDATAKVAVHVSATDPHGDRAAAASDATTKANAAQAAALGAAATDATSKANAAQDAAIAASAQRGSNLSDLASASAARTNLGLGAAATLSVGTTGGTVAAGNDSRLSDARPPAAHASSHGSGGSDPVAVAQSQVTGLSTTLAGKAAKGEFWVNVLDNGLVLDAGASDQTAALNTLLVSIPDKTTVFFPPGTYRFDTVTSNKVLYLHDKRDIYLLGGNTGAIITSTSAQCRDQFRLENLERFSMQNIRATVSGTARFTNAFATTTTSPGSAHFHEYRKVFINGALGTGSLSTTGYRRAWDCTTTAGSATIWSAQTGQTDYQGGSPWLSRQFSAADVGRLVTVNLPGVAPLCSIVQSYQAFSATLASGIDSSTLSIPLSAPLQDQNGNPAPSGGFTISIDNELFSVSSGGTTTTLTCSSRGRGLVYPASTHLSGATVSTSSATLADNASVTVSNATAPLRVQMTDYWYINGWGVGNDSPGASNLDLAQLAWFECDVVGVAGPGWETGNGTTANVLNMHTYGCSVGESGWTVHMNGCNLTWHGGGMGTNLGFFKRTHPGADSIAIKDFRCDGAAVLWEGAQAATVGPAVSLENIAVNAANPTDGIVINHLDSTPIFMKNIDIQMPLGVAVKIVTQGTSASPCYVVAQNVTTTSGVNPFVTSGSVVKRWIIPGPKKTAPTQTLGADVYGGFTTDHRMNLNGGMARSRRAVADAATTLTAADSVVAYTSLTAARVATLPAQSTVISGQDFVIKDESGSCDGTKTITITPPSGTIDGAVSLVLNSAYAKASVYTNGTNWFSR
jgi:hypothetical protein